MDFMTCLSARISSVSRIASIRSLELFVIGGSGPARGLEQRPQVGRQHRPVGEAVWAPPFGQQRLDGIICRCLLDAHGWQTSIACSMQKVICGTRSRTSMLTPLLTRP